MGTRGKLMACTGAALMLLTTPAAIADEEIVATTPNRYQNPDVTIDQGEKLTFRNTDFVMHDVVSEAKGSVRDSYLFASDTVSNNATSFVEGSQYLTTGDYAFYCSVHPQQMKGTLHVSSAGTPVPRPGSGGGGSSPPPEPLASTLTTRPTKASALRAGKRLKATVGTNKAATLKLTAAFRGTKAGSVTQTFTTGGSRLVAVSIKKSIRRKLRKGSKLKLTLAADDGSGTPQSQTVTLKLK